jgi:hypothetical protein
MISKIPGEVVHQGTTPLYLTPDQAFADFYNWDGDHLQDFMAKLRVIGKLGPQADFSDAANEWQKLVVQAARFGAQGQKVSPWDLLSMEVASQGKPYRKGDWEYDPVSGTRTYVGPQFVTKNTSRVDLTDPQTARAIAQSVFQQLLGRDAGPGEIAQFAGALNQAEQASPIQQTVVNEYDDQHQLVGQNVTKTSGGLTDQARQQIAADQIKANPEYGATQAATTYMDALHRAIYGNG